MKRAEIWYIRVSKGYGDICRDYTGVTSEGTELQLFIAEISLLQEKCHEVDNLDCILHSCGAAAANGGSHGSRYCC